MGVQKSRVSFFKSSQKFYANYNLKNSTFFNTNFWFKRFYKKKRRWTWWTRLFGMTSYQRGLRRWRYLTRVYVTVPKRSFNTAYISRKKIKTFSIMNKQLIRIGGDLTEIRLTDAGKLLYVFNYHKSFKAFAFFWIYFADYNFL